MGTAVGWTSAPERIKRTGVKLVCEQCGLEGTRDLDFIWFSALMPKLRGTGTIRRWLCPECAGEFPSKEQREQLLLKLTEARRRR